MESVEDNNKPASRSTNWPPNYKKPIVKSTNKEGHDFPIKPLTPRSFIEVELNDVYDNYIVPKNKEEDLNDLIYTYNATVESTIVAIKRWKSKRGEDHLNINGLLFLERTEIFSITNQIEHLMDINKQLFDLLQSFKPKNSTKLTNITNVICNMLNR